MEVVRLASLDDVEQILDILISGFSSKLLPLTILGCAGISHYLSDVISLKPLGHYASFVVIASAGTIKGVAEFRSFEHSLFLNYIAVIPYERNKGLGRRLLLEGIQLIRNRTQLRLELDVFFDNHSATRWYQSLGLKPIYEKKWYEVSNLWLQPKEPLWWTVKNLEQADLIHAKYGFSNFYISTQQKQYLVDRLGTKIFRVTDSTILEDASLFDALSAINPERQIVLITAGDYSSGKNPKIITMSKTFTGNIDQLLTHPF